MAQPRGSAAPDALRKRVLSRVNSEPEPARRRLAHAASRRLRGRGPVLAAVLLFGALLAACVALLPLGGSSRPLGKTSLAAEFRSAHAALHRVGAHAELNISGMPQAPVGEVYQVWLARRGGAPRPTDALFTVTKAGNGSVEVPGTLRGIREVMVTREPVGGSSHPTSPAVLEVQLGRDSSG